MKSAFCADNGNDANNGVANNGVNLVNTIQFSGSLRRELNESASVDCETSSRIGPDWAADPKCRNEVSPKLRIFAVDNRRP